MVRPFAPTPLPVSDFTDETLMVRVRAGERDALGLLFERHHTPLYGYFVRMTGDRAESDDLVQTVFERLLKYRNTYRTGAPFTAWLYRIARNTANDYFQRRRQAPTSTPISTLAQHPTEPAAVEATHQRAQLYQALQALPQADRNILLLSQIEGLGYPELAEVMGTSVNAVRIRVCRALKALKVAYHHLESL